jgi:hypothetical protein
MFLAPQVQVFFGSAIIISYSFQKASGPFCLRANSATAWAAEKNTFIEYSKNFIDYINAWHSEQPKRLDVSDFTRSAYSLHYYSSVLVIEKRPMEKPYSTETGNRRLPEFKPPSNHRFKRWFQRKFTV